METHIRRLMPAVLGVLAFACGSSETPEIREEKTARATTEVVQQTTISDRFRAPGTITARTSSVLSFNMAGQILSISAREGDRVKKGQAIAEIDGRETSARLRGAEAAQMEALQAQEESARTIRAAEAALRAAEANGDLAASTLERYELLRERGSISDQEYDEIRTRYKASLQETGRAQEMLAATRARTAQVEARIQQAQAQVDAARITSGYSQIVAPINGIVTARHAEPGMLATPGAPMITIEDDSSYQLEAAVEESSLRGITLGQNVEIEVDALGARLQGRVSEIVPAGDSLSRTYTVKVALQPTAGKINLRSGFFARALFPAGERTALIVPAPAIVQRGQLTGVYLVQGDSAIFRLVKTGARIEQGIEIVSGLTAGARIVVAPGPEVSDGVKIIEAPRPESTP
jgi:RND family efflux transporter MFP subunit